MKRVIGILFCGLVACGGEATSDDPVVVVNNGGNVDNNSQPTVRCADVCPSKAAQCQAPPEQIDALCGMFCGSGDERTLVNCLQTKGCEELAEGFERGPDAVCDPAPPPPPRDMGTNNPPDMSTAACEVGERRCDDDYTAVRCDRSSTGGVIQSVDRCQKPIPNVSPGTVCEQGWCIDPRLLQENSTCSDRFDCRSPLDCQGGLCCQVEGEICAEDRGCCGGAACVSTAFGYKVCKLR